MELLNVSKLAVSTSNAVNRVRVELLNVSKLAVSTSNAFNRVIAEPLAVDNWSNLLFCVVLVVSFDAVYEFRELNIPITCEEPLTTVSAFNLVLIVVFIEDVKLSKLAVSTSNAVNRVNVEELNVSKLAVSTSNIFNLLIAEPLAVDNWSNLLFWVVLVVSFDEVYVFNELNIPITCDEPETTVLVFNCVLIPVVQFVVAVASIWEEPEITFNPLIPPVRFNPPFSWVFEPSVIKVPLSVMFESPIWCPWFVTDLGIRFSVNPTSVPNPPWDKGPKIASEEPESTDPSCWNTQLLFNPS